MPVDQIPVLPAPPKMSNLKHGATLLPIAPCCLTAVFGVICCVPGHVRHPCHVPARDPGRVHLNRPDPAAVFPFHTAAVPAADTEQARAAVSARALPALAVAVAAEPGAQARAAVDVSSEALPVCLAGPALFAPPGA